MRKIIIIICVFLWSVCYSQEEISPKDVFSSVMKTNKISPSDKLTYSAGITLQWVDIYASYFDKVNYINSVNDEFLRVPFLKAKYKEMNESINNFKLSKVFYFTTNLPFERYDADCGCFPLLSKDFIDFKPTLLDVLEVGKNKFWYDNPFLRVSIGGYSNFEDFNFVLKMNTQEGAKFVNSKKDANGDIKRLVKTKVYYNITNMQFKHKENIFYVGAYLHKFEFYDGAVLIGTIRPKRDYFDKVNMVLKENGSEKFFFDQNGNEINKEDSLIAKSYSIFKYNNGRLESAINYMMNGQIKSQSLFKYSDTGDKFGEIVKYYENGLKKIAYETYNDKRTGLYTSWYANGQKEVETRYVSNKIDGKFTAWHLNGFKKEELIYIDGIENSCHFKWDENGKCIGSTKAINGDYKIYAEYFENGKFIYNSKCPCTDSKQEIQIQKKINLDELTIISLEDICGYYEGISESTGNVITINSNGVIEYITNETSYKGTASIIKTEEKELEFVQQKLPEKLKREFKITGNSIQVSMTINNKNKNSGFIVVLTDNGMILWGGGDALFEKLN